jgi:hypothetical protein
VPLQGGMATLRKKFGAIRLSEADPDGSYEILRVYERDPKFLEFLSERALRPATHLRLHKKEYDETIAMSVENGPKDIHLGKPASERIWVRKIS